MNVLGQERIPITKTIQVLLVAPYFKSLFMKHA